MPKGYFLAYREKLALNENIYTDQIEIELISFKNSAKEDGNKNFINLSHSTKEINDEESQRIFWEINNPKNNILNNKNIIRKMAKNMDNKT